MKRSSVDKLFSLFFYFQSHLRGQILPKEAAPPIEDSYKLLYESILESEQPQPKSKHTQFVIY